MSAERLPQNWKWQTLADIAANVPNAIVDGPFGSSLKTSDYVQDGIPVLQGKNISENRFRWTDIRYISEHKAQELRRSSLRPGDILMIKIGSIGYSALVPELYGHGFAIIPANLAKITLDVNKVDTSYVLHWLQSVSSIRYLQSVASKTAQPALSLSKIKNLPVPIPELKEQRRIAAILDQADALRTKRRQALAKLDTLTQALFLEMFGDPIANPHGFERGNINLAVADPKRDVRCGPFGTQLKVAEITPSGVPLLGIENVHDNRFVASSRKYISPQKADFLRAFDAKAGDVLITRMGTIGRACVVPAGSVEARFSYHLFRVRPEPDLCTPEFLAATISRGGVFQRELKRLARGAIMDGLNTEMLRSIVFLLPPVRLQRVFTDRIGQFERTRDKLTSSLDSLDRLFASLQHWAFRGEL